MHLPVALLALPLLFAILHAAETPRVDPETPVAPPSAEAAAPATKPDEELVAVRRLLEAGGLIVTEISRMDSGKPCATVRLGLGGNPRLREQEFFAFAEPSRAKGLWLIRLGMAGHERAGLNEEPHGARGELAARLRQAPFLRDVMAGDGEGEDEDGERAHLFHASHHATVSDPRAFAAFLADFSEALSDLFSVEAEGLPLLITGSERELQPLVMARKNLADRLRVRAIQGLPVPAPGTPAAEDPLSMASHALNPQQLHPLEGAGRAAEILPELESSGLAALPGHRALRLFLSLIDQPGESAPLVSLR